MVSIISSLIAAALYHCSPITSWILEAVYSVVLCITLRATASYFLTKKILEPINRLSQAMSKVARGDFTIRLKTKNKLSEIQNLYGDFNLMVEELSATETLQMDSVSNVSHEIKTPISAIDGYTMLLQGTTGISSD